jgi:hypothetical protein
LYRERGHVLQPVQLSLLDQQPAALGQPGQGGTAPAAFAVRRGDGQVQPGSGGGPGERAQPGAVDSVVVGAQCFAFIRNAPGKPLASAMGRNGRASLHKVVV